MDSEPARRLTIQFVWAEVLAFLSWEKGAFYTAPRLMVRPGKTIRAYLDGKRDRLTNPIRFLLMACAIVTAAFVFLMPRSAYLDENAVGIPDSWESVPPELKERVAAARAILTEIADASEEQFLTKNCQDAIQVLERSFASQFGEITLTWMNVFLLFALPINSLISWVCFRKAQLNLAEHFAANAYILAAQNFASLAVVLLAILNWGDPTATTGVYMLLSFVYQFVAWKQVFQLSGLLQYVVGFFALLLSVIGFLLLQGIASAIIYAMAV